ncbi:6-carboxytetrahydropterin synthase [Pseudoalteromonas sp. 2CM32C]|uniref:6-carboxytetrahydropterin synthase n=1 Tax=Pseudoalteromonas sp. 2CM32C TaxID=2929852 RepID=UPI0020BF1271|nr:6-carboxytetrahydropterin synthase [Pseudoalteromonas sp. 2CM32C]MCK8122416.1 6-carboxytetrahydropterin synthase [Pseudoalteromonas sp. 2CM32C]
MILFVNSLTVIDFSYLCNKRGAVGESWIVDLTLHGKLNDESMVLDFGLVKKQIKGIIDECIDHRLAIPNSINGSVTEFDEHKTLDCTFGDNHHLAMSAPHQAYCMIDSDEINVESVTAFLVDTILPKLPSNIEKIELSLKPEHSQSFYYHYSHGLKKHDGNCQRIIHGHRSQIGISLDGISMPRLQKEWAMQWEDIYLATSEDQIEPQNLKYISARDNDVCFAYTSAHGYFEMAISETRCDILPIDTTVECIAGYIAGQVKAKHPEQNVKITAYEGVGKGAISYA